MKRTRALTVYLLTAIFVAESVFPASLFAANPLEKALDVGHDVKRWLLLEKPDDTTDACVTDVARQIDWLEHKIDTYGTVVSKQPDVWGEARMTKHRQEVEKELAKRLGVFEENLQGAIKRSDQSFLAAAMTLNAASSSEGLTALQGSTTTPSITTQTFNMLPNPNATGQDMISRSGPGKIDLSDYGYASSTKDAAGNARALDISLEPTLVTEQLNRYLQHLNEMRRINEGDDTSDSPGYSLNLVRLPISVLPGKMTRKGYGAEITFTATPYVSDDLLPTTMRSLIVNDVVNLHTLPISQFLLNDPAAAKGQIETLRNQDARVSRWVEYFDHWLTTLQHDLNNDPGYAYKEELERSIRSLHTNHSYLHNRFFQIAEVAEQQEKRGLRSTVFDEKKKLSNSDYAYLKTVSIGNNTSILLGITYQQLADFFDGLTENKPSSPLHFYYAVAESPLPTAHESIRCRLKRYNQIDEDISVTRSLPVATEKDGSTSTSSHQPTTQFRLTSTAAKLVEQMQSFESKQQALQLVFTQSYDNFTSKALDHIPLEVPLFSDPTVPAVLATRPVQAERPLPPSLYYQVIGADGFAHMACSTANTLSLQLAERDVSTYLDIRSFLVEETQAAYKWLSQERNLSLWTDFATPVLARAIRERDIQNINILRNQFIKQVGPETEHRVTASLAWSILVNAALLNERLTEDMNHIAISRNCPELRVGGLTFVGPRDLLMPPAQEAFKLYVNTRWPIQIFALDPTTQDQNIADIFSRRREMQLALAAGVAQGTVRASAAMRYARRLETDIETIGLNRTSVAFSHGPDTFGWRFYPRVQSPDTPGTMEAFYETVAGGPSQDKDLRDRGLEPGIRECSAIIVMPSFVPHVQFESRANWFGLTNPRKKVWTMNDAMTISSNYQAVQRALRCANESCAYRPGDVSQLSNVVAQLDRRMPLQQMLLPVPYENTLGGFEIFNAGITDLAPELHGWFGAPGIRVGTVTKTTTTAAGSTSTQEEGTPTTLFLVGGRFSVHDTKVIVGGRAIPDEDVTLVSREIMQITIPTDVGIVSHPVKQGDPNKYVDIHIATPYGVTSHLLVPEIDLPKTAEQKTKDALTASVESLGKQVEAIVKDTVSLQIQSTGGQKLSLLAFNSATKPKLQFATADSSTPLSVSIVNQNALPLNGKLHAALFTTKGFVTTLFEVKKHQSDSTLDLSSRSQALNLDAIELAKVLTDANSGIDASGFDASKKLLAKAVFYLQQGADPLPIRMLGEVSVEITLLPENPAMATTTTGAGSPASHVLPPLQSPSEPEEIAKGDELSQLEVNWISR